MGSASSRPVLTRSQQQDELVKMAPDGTARVIRRPKTNPDGSDIVTTSDFEFPKQICYERINRLTKAFQLDPNEVFLSIWEVREFCGIEVDLERMKNSHATSSTSGEQKNQSKI